MIDFDAMVLAPAMETFAREAVHRPPGGAVLPRRGVFTRPHEIGLDSEGAYHSSDMPMLGIRLPEWSPTPARGHRIEVAGQPSPFEVWDVQPDGQGGARLLLKEIP